MKYERSLLRKLIKALTPLELDESLDNFPAVRNQFTDGQAQDLRINIILDYFERHQEKIDKLLEAIKECNSEAYNNYVSELESLSSPILTKELNLDSDLINELKAIFRQQDKSFWQCAKRVYEDFLLGLDQDDLVHESGNLSEDLLSDLGDWSEETIILEFVPRLAAYLSTQDINQYRTLVDQVKQIAKYNIRRLKNITIDDFNQRLKHFRKDYKTSLDKAYLLIKIKKLKLSLYISCPR
ncbi:MAG: hypothetical protein ACIWVG_11790, partial [Gloeotrichia echinulata HAB0833]